MAALARRYPSPPSDWCEDFHLASYRTCSAHRVRSQSSPADAALDCGRRCGSAVGYAVAARLPRHAATLHATSSQRRQQFLTSQRRAIDECLQRSFAVAPATLVRTELLVFLEPHGS